MLSCPPTTSPSPSPPPPTNTMTSDPRHAAMETYWREVQSIEEEKEGEDEDEEEEERKSMDGKSNLQQSETFAPCLISTCLCLPAEVELEEAWLTEAGLSSLVTGSSEDEAPPPAEAVLSTLTRQQTATVRRRLDIYNETLKKRNKQPIRDVRDIFTQDQLPEHPSSPTNTHSPSNTHSLTLTPSPPHTHSPPVSQSRRADWLLRDSTYSEGVAEHKRGGTCWDCLHFIEDDNSDLSFVPVCPSQDLTWADDLSSCDLTQLCFISHIELSTFLVALGVQTKHTRPPRHRTRDGGVFGVPLNSLLENDRKKFPGIKVPVVFQKLLCILEQTGLQTEGILRVPGSAARLKYLRRELDRCGGDLDWSAVRQVDAAGLLKLFIRELPTPLLTHTHLSTYRVSSVLHQVQALQLLSLLLPEVNRDTLRALLVFLRKVVSHQDQNRMSLWNVSMVMAPNLFSCRHHGNKLSITKQREEMEEAVGGAQLIRLMITHQDLLWIVPSFLLSQVRRMNQATNQKQSGLTRTGRRLLRRKSDKNDRNQITEVCEGVIRVCAPLHTKVSMAIQLDGQMRAKDVTARFEFENSFIGMRDQKPIFPDLYEVGGNICERRLHPDCILLDVYRANPHCDWLIKP
uniref:Rho GTPase-activating protein 28-like n=1 Tax=Seriola dumerili TaxID=41447 RepID=A0A3B4U4X1_SERDU